MLLYEAKKNSQLRHNLLAILANKHLSSNTEPIIQAYTVFRIVLKTHY
uniref:Uncharacterized protein n=1 Tax=Anguilla anguilla TaxID=7936 RepID=A0A0E9QPG5_ANGAN